MEKKQKKYIQCLLVALSFVGLCALKGVLMHPKVCSCTQRCVCALKSLS